MKTAGYDNIEVARELLNILDWVLECYQFEEKEKEMKNNPFTLTCILPKKTKKEK